MVNLEEAQKIKSILNSVKKLSSEEQKTKRAEIDKIRREKGEDAVQDFLLKNFKLD